MLVWMIDFLYLHMYILNYTILFFGDDRMDLIDVALGSLCVHLN